MENSFTKPKYNTYILEFIRNNTIMHKNSVEESADVSNFIMLDYFNVLRCRELKGADKTYTNYFSMSDMFNADQQNKVSYKTLSLYRHAGCGETNPFEFKDDKKNVLSSMPFLGVIQICLCKESYSCGKLDKGEVEEFLLKMECAILKAVEDIVPKEEKETTQLQIYRSSTTGDFCLIMRTGNINRIYKAASRLNNSRYIDGDCFKVLTYTNVGIECRKKSGGDGNDIGYCGFRDSFINEHNDIIAMRFSLDSNYYQMMRKYIKIFGSLEKGLFGRYDYLLHLNIKEFASIYPELCSRIFGDVGNGQNIQEMSSDPKRFFTNPNVRNINGRILIDTSNEQDEIENDNNYKGEPGKKELGKNGGLYNRIQNIESYTNIFFEENRTFHNLVQGMKELYKVFASAAMEKDSVINWHIWYNDMKVLCECIEEEMDIYFKLECEEKRKMLRVSLLKSWQISLHAINEYTRLVQNINYQTYQSPVYEIQTQIDTEKIMVAYREAMRIYAKGHADAEKENNVKLRCIEPIVYPDFREEKVSVKAPFTSVWFMLKNKRSITCTVPSFEYFGRMYDLLPWLLHETSHYLRTLTRSERNLFVVRFLLKHVFVMVIDKIVRINSHVDRYVSAGKAGKDLLDSFIDVAVSDIKEEMGRHKISYGDYPSYEQMVYIVAVYLDKLFPYDDGVNENFDVVKESVFNTFLAHIRQTGILENGNEDGQEKLLNKLKKLKEGNKDLESAGEIAGRLLLIYGDKLNNLLNKEKARVTLINVEDLGLPLRRFEQRILEIYNELQCVCSKCDAIMKEYAFSVKEIYRFYAKYVEVEEKNIKSDSFINTFLENAYKEYEERAHETQSKECAEIMDDPEFMYIIRNAGMLGDEKDFVSKMSNVFKRISNSDVQDLKIQWSQTYREACADIMMATSLQISGFGYCRQVMQTVSDSKIKCENYLYDSINYNRFRVVTAVLAVEEEKAEKECFGDEYDIDCSEIIEQGKQYCIGTLKCIEEKLLNHASIRDDCVKRELALDFLGDIGEQLVFCLGKMGNKEYKNTLLCLLLHGEPDDIDVRLRSEWRKYDDIIQYCDSFRYLFWRLECFCRGVETILPGGHIVVDKMFFDHISDTRREIAGECNKGCKWESNMWECMYDVKKDVGNFYNNPYDVYKKTSSMKLENTIEFVQNFYYHNRLEMVKEGGWFDEQKLRCKCEVCGKSC